MVSIQMFLKIKVIKHTNLIVNQRRSSSDDNLLPRIIEVKSTTFEFFV